MSADSDPMPQLLPNPPVEPAGIRQVLAENIVALRKAKGFSQEALAFESGLHRTFIAHVERRVRNISLDNIDRIARALGVPAWVLLVPRSEQPALRPAAPLPARSLSED